MKRLGFAGAATLAILTSATAIGQSSAIPAEFPPASFTGNQYVDSNGCAFIRAGRNGVTNWVPRVNRRRDQLCNFQPTIAGSTATAAPAPAPTARVAPLDAPIIEITAPAPEPRNPLRDLLTGAPAAAAAEDAPIETVASLPAAPAPVVAPPPAPIEITAPAPVAAPEPTLTLAEACEGRFGIQPGFISASTGNPIDCGPAPQAAAPAPIPTPAPVVPEPARITFAEACEGRFGIQTGFISASTGNPIDCGPAPQVASAPVAAPVAAPAAAPIAALEQRRITLAEACAEMGTTNYRYISAQTGQPIVCPDTNQTASAQSGSGILASLFQRKNTVPASNPVVTKPEHIRPPSSYDRVWGDGRLNTQRGLPAATAPTTVAKAPAAVAPPQQARVSTRTAPQTATGPSHRYIQVGTFGDHSNADRLMQRLGAAGLPVGTGASGAMKIVAVGPFSSQADLQRALQTVRGMGFSDAYPRN